MSRSRKTPTTHPVYFTTNDVALMFGVSNQTVVNWVKSGLLAAHKTPGGHRRIGDAEIVRFARSKEYPVPTGLVSANGAKKRVLVVDDEADFSDTVREYLVARASLEVEVASSGFSAGQTVERFKPDLILLDLLMPGLDGFDVHRLLRGDPKTAHIPVLACTAYRDPDMDRRIRDAGFDEFIEKPLKLDELLDRILDRLQSAP